MSHCELPLLPELTHRIDSWDLTVANKTKGGKTGLATDAFTIKISKNAKSAQLGVLKRTQATLPMLIITHFYLRIQSVEPLRKRHNTRTDLIA